MPLSELPAGVKRRRSGSFGAVAADYQRFRPAPPPAALDWLLPNPLGRAVDLGAGTGRLTEQLVARADEVVAVEPDERMRSVLLREMPDAIALDGRGEAIPLPDRSVDAVVAATSWHWMDPVETVSEVARVLVPGGVLGVMWTGPDDAWRAVSSAKAVHDRRPHDGRRPDAVADGSPRGEMSRRLMAEVLRPVAALEIPAGMPFDAPEHRVFPWKVALDTDELIGLLGTFSWVLTLPDGERATLFAETRSFLAEVRGIRAGAKVDIPFRAEVWRARRQA
jgi:SAM-dependent methyltransferase